jgi:hypothetical protein
MSEPGGTGFATTAGRHATICEMAGATAANAKAASRRLVVKSALPIQKILERAKRSEYKIEYSIISKHSNT